jgi:hypothetical protein
MQNGRHFYLILFIYFSKIGKPINLKKKRLRQQVNQRAST